MRNQQWNATSNLHERLQDLLLQHQACRLESEIVGEHQQQARYGRTGTWPSRAPDGKTLILGEPQRKCRPGHWSATAKSAGMDLPCRSASGSASRTEWCRSPGAEHMVTKTCCTKNSWVWWPEILRFLIWACCRPTVVVCFVRTGVQSPEYCTRRGHPGCPSTSWWARARRHAFAARTSRNNRRTPLRSKLVVCGLCTCNSRRPPWLWDLSKAGGMEK